MLRSFTPFLFAAAMLCACPVALAAPVLIAGSAADAADGPNGSNSDTTTGTPLAVSFTGGTFSGYRITRVEWWGYDFDPPADNEFDVSINGSPVLTTAAAGVVGTTPFPLGVDPDIPLTHYFLDVSSFGLLVGNSNTLAVQSTDPGAFWFWQQAAGSPDYAFQVFGEDPGPGLPEPASLWLVALAGLGLLATRRRA